MEINLKVNIRTFTVPNDVLINRDAKPKSEGFKPSDSIHLSELDAETLEKLCENFTREVFHKAGKQRLPRSE